MTKTMIKTRKIRYKVKRIYSPWKKKLLLFFLGGALAGTSKSPSRIINFLASLPDEFKKIDKEYLKQLIREFRRDRLVDMVDISDEETNGVANGSIRTHLNLADPH